METDKDFSMHIKKWVVVDNHSKQLNEKLRELRVVKNDLKKEIFKRSEENNLKNATINITDGRLRFVEVKQTSPLTMKYVEKCLKECINNEEQVETLMSYIKNNRQYKYVPEIKRYHEDS